MGQEDLERQLQDAAELAAFMEEVKKARDQLQAEAEENGWVMVDPERVGAAFRKYLMEGFDFEHAGYEPNGDRVERLVRVYAFFRAYSDEYTDDGVEVVAAPTPLDATIKMDVEEVEFTGEVYQEFLKVLPEISSMQFAASDHDSILVEVCVKDVWKEAGQ